MQLFGNVVIIVKNMNMLMILLESFYLCLLHILPLTFVAAMNIMIIVRLRQRQKLMSVSTNLLSSQVNGKKKKNISYTIETPSETKQNRKISQPTLSTTRKDQATSTDLLGQSPPQLTVPSNITTPRRHHSRDRTITIMLVSVALSYLILTLPYRLFWSYNVYIKRMHPEKLNSSSYLLNMHHIDHVLRTIRNIHYGTNFVFFIFLSKTFRRKFRQIFIDNCFRTINRIFHRKSSTNNSDQFITLKTNRQRRSTNKLDKKRHLKTIPNDRLLHFDDLSRNILDEPSSIMADVRIQEDEITPIIELEHSNHSRYDGE